MMKLEKAKEKKLEMEREKVKEKELEDCTFKPRITEFNASVIDRSEVLKSLVGQVCSAGKSPEANHESLNQFEEPE